MWQRFTEYARRAVFFAQEDGQRFGESYVSTEHLLLGIIRDDGNCARQVLEALSVSADQIREEIEKQLPEGDASPRTDMTLTPRAKRVIDLAYDEARNFGHDYIGTEHLLLGLVREGDGLAGRVLTKLGIDLERTRTEALRFSQEVVGTPMPPPKNVAKPYDWASFDDGAQHTMLCAEQESKTVGEDQVSPLHLFLGVLETQDSLALKALQNLGIERDQVREEIEKHRVWAAGSPSINLSPNGRKVVDAAFVEARMLGNEHIGAEHLLLGLIRGNEGGAGQIFSRLGVNTAQLRAEIKKLQEKKD